MNVLKILWNPKWGSPDTGYCTLCLYEHWAYMFGWLERLNVVHVLLQTFYTNTLFVISNFRKHAVCCSPSWLSLHVPLNQPRSTIIHLFIYIFSAISKTTQTLGGRKHRQQQKKQTTKWTNCWLNTFSVHNVRVWPPESHIHTVKSNRSGHFFPAQIFSIVV